MLQAEIDFTAIARRPSQMRAIDFINRLPADTAMIEKLFEMGQGGQTLAAPSLGGPGPAGIVNIRRDYVGSLPQEF